MSGSVGGSSEVEINMTPILDMVFQLITFFMLVVNFKAAALDLDLKLPVIGSAAPVDTQGEEEVLVININSEGRIRSYGQTVSDLPAFLAVEAQVSLTKARHKHPDLQKGEELPCMVVLRADRSTPFTQLNTVITACQQHGFLKFALKAMNRQE